MSTVSELKQINYASWQNGNEWSEEEIAFILKKGCVCDHCETNVKDLGDFPELLIEEDELLCEDCYSVKYRVLCPICENSYDIKDGESPYSVKTEQEAKDEGEIAGIYENGSLLIPIKINELKRIDCGPHCCEVYSADICSDCVSDLVRKENFIKCRGIGTPILLIKGYENSPYLKQLTPERLKRKRQKLIHERITIRGIIQKANSTNIE